MCLPSRFYCQESRGTTLNHQLLPLKKRDSYFEAIFSAFQWSLGNGTNTVNIGFWAKCYIFPSLVKMFAYAQTFPLAINFHLVHWSFSINQKSYNPANKKVGFSIAVLPNASTPGIFY